MLDYSPKIILEGFKFGNNSVRGGAIKTPEIEWFEVSNIYFCIFLWYGLNSNGPFLRCSNFKTQLNYGKDCESDLFCRGAQCMFIQQGCPTNRVGQNSSSSDCDLFIKDYKGFLPGGSLRWAFSQRSWKRNRQTGLCRFWSLSPTLCPSHSSQQSKHQDNNIRMCWRSKFSFLLLLGF